MVKHAMTMQPYLTTKGNVSVMLENMNEWRGIICRDRNEGSNFCVVLHCHLVAAERNHTVPDLVSVYVSDPERLCGVV